MPIDMNPTEITIATLLMTAVVTLWKWIQTNLAEFKTATAASLRELKARTDECETDREQINERLNRHAQQLAVFRACPSKPCPAREGLTRSEEFATTTSSSNHN